MKIKEESNLKNSLESVIKKMYFIPSVLERLNRANIRYGLYAGAVVKSLAGSGELSDLDFLVRDEDSMKLKDIFPFAKTKDVGDGCYLYVGGDEENLEFMFCADISVDGHLYRHRLTDFAFENIWFVELEDVSIPFTHIVETILFKANLQREKDFKHLEILASLVELENTDIEYAKERVIEIGCDERTRRGLVSFPELHELIDFGS